MMEVVLMMTMVMMVPRLCDVFYPNPPGPGGEDERTGKMPTGEGPLTASRSQEEKRACADE